MTDQIQKAPDETDEGKLPYVLGAFIIIAGVALGSIPFFWQGLPEDVVNIRMNARIADDLPWHFRSSMTLFHVKVGETIKTSYVARNPSSENTKGLADFSVSPEVAAIYISKIECFCFREQDLAPGAVAELPVTFSIDPEIKNDPDTKDLKSITFHYTFRRYTPSDS